MHTSNHEASFVEALVKGDSEKFGKSQSIIPKLREINHDFAARRLQSED